MYIRVYTHAHTHTHTHSYNFRSNPGRMDSAFYSQELHVAGRSECWMIAGRDVRRGRQLWRAVKTADNKRVCRGEGVG